MTSELDAELLQHRDAWSAKDLSAMSDHLTRYGYAKVSGLLPERMLNALRAEARTVCDKAARRIDITIKETSNSPRRLGSVNVRDIEQFGTLIPALYYSKQMRAMLEAITRHPVLDCDWDNERMTMTRQEKAGDTHGWHWGDYQYALIFIVDHPPIDHGGMLQCVPHTTWNKQNPRVHEILSSNPIYTFSHEPGDIYFFRTDTTLHRTSPLEKDGVRIILNFTFDGPDGAVRMRTHETQSAIYDF